MRFVCDYRALNDFTKKDTYPLPFIKGVVDRMGGSLFWSKLDATSAYWSKVRKVIRKRLLFQYVMPEHILPKNHGYSSIWFT